MKTNFEKESAIPKDGIAGLKENWKGDLKSAFLVFLIALPLCLGISMASGFPPVAGILTAIVGGVIVAPLMGARLTIKGPAAGLIAIAIACVTELGNGNVVAGYKYALAVVVVTGIIQVIMGLSKFGRFVDFFPSSAVHGMLAAIGIIIVIKQVPVLLGATAESKNPLALILEIPSLIMKMNPEVAVIGLLSLAILFSLLFVKNKWIKMIPAPMLVLLVAIPLGAYFDLQHEHQYLFLDHHYFIGPKQLVTLPGNIADAISFPDFSQVLSWTSVKFILMFVLVGSIESLLTVKAMDGQDPYHRKSNTNRDLWATGAGNAVSGLIGGLPMIAEVVRSSANVNNGAKTRWANFFHGCFLLIFVAFFPGLLHRIPLSALAAMLIYTGYRLSHPSLYKKTYQIGKEQIAIFLVTIIVTLAEDLILGIASGIILKIIFQLASGVPVTKLFTTSVETEEKDGVMVIRPRNAAVFSNFLGFKKYLENTEGKKKVIIDFSNILIIDHTFMEQIHHFRTEYERKGGQLEIIGDGHLEKASDHHLAARKVARKAMKVIA